MSTLDVLDTTSIEVSKDDSQSYLRRILKYKVFIICLSMLLVGILFLVTASLLHTDGVGAHLLRDIGIVLVTTGLVVFAADYMTRKDFIALLATELNPLRTDVNRLRRSMLGEMLPLRTDMTTLITKLLQEITPLRSDIPTLSTALDDVRKCISLGATMSVLGIKHIHKDRGSTDLLNKLWEAANGSEIKILGIVASGVSDPKMEDIIRQKLMQQCKFKILCVNPSSHFVEERAAEEGRSAQEMKNDISARIMGWRNFVESHIPEAMRSQVELKCHDGGTRYFLFITETMVVVGFYLGAARGASNVHLELEVKPDGIAKAFIEHFDSLWNAAKSPATQPEYVR